MRLHNLLSLLLLATMLSCGNSSHQKRKLMHRNPYVYEEGYDDCVNHKSSEVKVVDEILDFEIKFKNFYDLFILKKYPRILPIVATKQRVKLPIFTVTQPLVLNPYALTMKFQNVIEQFQSRPKLYHIYQEVRSDGDNVPDLGDELIDILSSLTVDLENLKNHAIRFKHAICKKQQLTFNQKYNVLPYIDQAKWGNAYHESEDVFFKFSREHLPVNLWEHFFSISTDQSKVDFICQKKQNKFQLIVSMYEADLDNHQMIKEAIESYWQSEEIKVVVSFINQKREDALKLKWVDSYSSYVDSNDPSTIVLGSKNENHFFKKILSHEFGHILGFNDCYAEFMDEAGQLVYYELNGHNLMCSLNGKFPSRIPYIYMQQVASKFCMVRPDF